MVPPRVLQCTTICGSPGWVLVCPRDGGGVELGVEKVVEGMEGLGKTQSRIGTKEWL